MPDIRTERTDEAIKQALLILLAEKPLLQITVSDLSRAAHVSRSTFYGHFSNVMGVFERLIADFFGEIRSLGFQLKCDACADEQQDARARTNVSTLTENRMRLNGSTLAENRARTDDGARTNSDARMDGDACADGCTRAEGNIRKERRAREKIPYCVAVRTTETYAALVKEPQYLPTMLRLMSSGALMDNALQPYLNLGTKPEIARDLMIFQMAGCHLVATRANDQISWTKRQRALDAFIAGGMAAVRAL